jgi:hypothetical protein
MSALRRPVAGAAIHGPQAATGGQPRERAQTPDGLPYPCRVTRVRATPRRLPPEQRQVQKRSGVGCGVAVNESSLICQHEIKPSVAVHVGERNRPADHRLGEARLPADIMVTPSTPRTKKG